MTATATATAPAPAPARAAQDDDGIAPAAFRINLDSQGTAAAGITTSQTIGPFFHDGLRWAQEATAQVATDAPVVEVAGTVFDGAGAPVVDAMLEAWTPGAVAHEQGAAVPGWRRAYTGEDGRFALRLSRPADAAAGAPLAYVTVFARGVLKHQFTAVFAADAPGLDGAPLLAQVPQDRRATLLARPEGGGYRWDVHLQGDRETVFLDYR
jgi:protocatechuate 3,4-dioxygenase alpha subunit